MQFNNKAAQDKQKRWIISDKELEDVLTCLSECLSYDNGVTYIYDDEDHPRNLDFLQEFEGAEQIRNMILSNLIPDDYRYTVEAKDPNFLKAHLHVFKVNEQLVRLNTGYIKRDDVVPSLEDFTQRYEIDSHGEKESSDKKGKTDLYDEELSATGSAPRERKSIDAEGDLIDNEIFTPQSFEDEGIKHWVCIYIKFYLAKNGRTVAVVSFHEDDSDKED